MIKTKRQGLVIGELLIAFVLLAVAISSLTALMYSVTRSPREQSEVVCSTKEGAASPKCASEAKAADRKLLLSGCSTRSGSRSQACHDSLLKAQATDGTIIRSRTDSVSLAMLPKKKKRARPDLGFVR